MLDEASGEAMGAESLVIFSIFRLFGFSFTSIKVSSWTRLFSGLSIEFLFGITFYKEKVN